MFKSSQKIGINFRPDEILGIPLYKVLPKQAAAAVMAKIDLAFKTGLPLWYDYALKGHSFLCLVERVDKKTVIVHEVMDDLEDRARIEKFLLVASGNFHRQLYRKDVG